MAWILVYQDLYPAREVTGQGAKNFLASFPECETDKAREFVHTKRAEGVYE